MSSLERSLRELITRHPALSATLAGALLGGIGESANVYFSLDPRDVGQAEYDRRVRKNMLRGALTGGAGALTAVHAYQAIKNPTFKYASAMPVLKIASASITDQLKHSQPGKLTEQGLAALKGSPLMQAVLGSGLLGAAAGGTLTALAPKRDGEDRASRRKRILRNAIITSLMAGGAVGAGGLAVRNLQTALPKNDHGDPISRTGEGLLRVAPGAAIAGRLAHKGMRGESASAQNLVARLIDREQRLGNGGGQGGKPYPFSLTQYFGAQTGTQTNNGKLRFEGKGPMSVQEALRRLVRDPDTLGGSKAEAGQMSVREYMQMLMRGEEAGGGKLKGYIPLGKKQLTDAGINPAFLDTSGRGSHENPNMLRTLAGEGELWKERLTRPGSSRLAGWPGALIAGAGLFTPELVNAAANAGNKTLQFASDKLGQN